MAFWRKPRLEGGKHRGVSKKEAKELTKIDQQLTDESFSKPTLSPLPFVVDQPLPLPPVKPESSTVPSDEISKRVYELLSKESSSDETFCDVLMLLQRRSGILERLNSLEHRIHELQTKAEEHGEALEEIKLDHHVESLSDDHLDNHERKHESILTKEEFRTRRHAMKSSVLLLTQLEASRETLVRDHTGLMESFMDLLPRGVDQELESILENEFRQCEERLRALSPAGTEDGEWLVTSPAAEEEFQAHLEEIATHGPVLADGSADSRFHLDP